MNWNAPERNIEMPSPIRFPSGVTNAARRGTLRMFGDMDPTKYHTFWDDFDNFEADQWVITRVGTTPTETCVSADGGRLLLTMAATDDSSDSLQWSGDDNAAVNETFKFVAGKKLWFKSRLQVSDITQSDFVMGLQITDTTPLAVTDGVYFRKDDGDSDLDFVVIKNSTATTTTISGVLANNTDIDLGFYYNGINAIEIFINDVQRGTSVVTNLVDDEELAISFHMQNGEAVAKTMSIDYILASKER
jgi:hypothetical protein